MSNLTNYLENKLVDHIFRGQTFTSPTTLYVALFTAAPSEAGGGTEATGGSYARAAVTSSLANWAGTQAAASTVASSGTSGATSNNAAITFATPTSPGWGTITHIAIMDAATGGNMLFWGALATSRTINAGDVVTYPAAALVTTFL